MKLFRFFFLVVPIVIFFWSCQEPKKESTFPKTSKRPNIIWLVLEDQSAQFFPMYGDSTVNLPYVEALARDGVVFDNAFATVPVCAPARSALVTGMYPTTLGTHNMRTIKVWTDENEPSINLPNYSPRVPEGTSLYPLELRRAGYYCTNNSKEDYNFRRMEGLWDDSSTNAHFRNRPADKPFFSVFNYGVCHESGIWKYQDSTLAVSPDSVSIPPYFPDHPKVRKDLAVNYSNLARADRQLGKIIDQLKEDGLYDSSYIFFYSDHGGPFPRHKRSLKDTGLKVPLVVKYPKGEKAGTRNDRLVNFIDFAPTILELTGIEIPKAMQGKSFIGNEEEAKALFFSSDRFDAQYDRRRAVRTTSFKLIQNFDTVKPFALPINYRQQMPTMQVLDSLAVNNPSLNQKYPWLAPTKPEWELYDLEEDPFELQNLANDRDYQQTMTHHQQLLSDWMEQTNDLGRTEEKELVAKWKADNEAPQVSLRRQQNGFEANPKDATLLFRQSENDAWELYDLYAGQTIPKHVKAFRIGYRESEILNFE